MVNSELALQAATFRLSSDLAPDMRADAAVRVMMQQLLGVMNVSAAGVLSGTDAECLHDYRIAIRRYRVLLGQIRGVIPQHDWQRFSRGFAWLGEVTRTARDLDVFLLNLEAYQLTLTSAGSDELDPVREFFRQQQQAVHQHLVACLNSARYSQLMAAWAKFMAAPLSAHSRLPCAQIPVLDWASRRIWRMLRRVVKEGKVIGRDSPPQALHELRKSCKKLRYLLEFSTSLYPAAMIKQLIKALKSLQDVLGEYQDVQVQQAFLSTFKQSGIADNPELQYTRMVVDLIMRRLEKRQRKLRKSFQRHFAVFVATRQQKLFKQLFKP